jgi:hypothetical protein
VITSLWLLIVPVLSLVAVCVEIVWLHASDSGTFDLQWWFWQRYGFFAYVAALVGLGWTTWITWSDRRLGIVRTAPRLWAGVVALLATIGALNLLHALRGLPGGCCCEISDLTRIYEPRSMVGYEPLGGLAPLSIACLCQASCVFAVLTVDACLARKRR